MLEEEAKPRYYIDQKWYNDHDRSFKAMGQARLCELCKKKLGTQTQERVPTIDSKTGRVVFELRNVPFAENPMSSIRSCCSKRRDYITPDSPLAEAIFRVFLANSNQPMDLERLREELGTYISLSERPHNYSAEIIEKMIKSDTYYGLRELILEAV